MSRAITVSNGNLLVGIDHRGQVRDLYFPFVGHANHVSGASGTYAHRIGVWVDGVLRWLSHDSWDISLHTEHESTKTIWHAINKTLGITLTMHEVVHNEHNVFIRNLSIENAFDITRTVKIFFGQEFRISESRRGDTAFYDPRVNSIIHYKGHDAFLVHAAIGEKSFTEYSVGLFGIENKEGTFLDAEDGVLSKNPIEHGSVDSVIGVEHEISAHESISVQYWIVAGHSINEIHSIHGMVLEETPERLLESTLDYWQAWVKKESKKFSSIEISLQQLYERSLLIMRSHTDNRGGIIASSDSDILNQGRDTYSYVWPRDAAMTAYAFNSAGYFDVTERLLRFFTPLLEKDGYLMHKYRVDGVLGSSWHPWLRDGVFELPIQEDETALPIYLLAQHYACAKNLEFVESLYNSFIEPASDFMATYIDTETGLPSESYDLWEEKFGSSTYTASAVYGALQGAAELSSLLGKREHATRYRNRAESIKRAILTYLYDADTHTFIKSVRTENKRIIRDTTLDMSSLYGLIRFDVLDPFDTRITQMATIVEDTLRSTHGCEGYVRYTGDRYYSTDNGNTPNPWCITTLWMAQYYVKVARTRKDLERAYNLLLWVRERATKSGVLPEQINPFTGAHLSTAPLVWSHAEFVITVDEYVRKYNSFSI